MLHLLEHYIDLSRDADWQAGSEPVITRPLIEIAEALDRSERQVRNIEHALAARGLLTWRDGGNCRRHGRRDPRSGRLLWAYGPTLAPLGARAAEIIALAEASRAAAGEARRLRLGLSALRRRVALLGEAAAAQGDATVAAAACTALAAHPARHRAGEDLDSLRRRHAALGETAERLEAAMAPPVKPATPPAHTGARPVNPAAREEIRRRPLPDTESVQAMNGYSRAAEKSEHRPPPWHAGAETADTVPLWLATRCAGPALREAMGRTEPDWGTLVAAACDTSRLLGIDETGWGEACRVLGRQRAALCVLILEHRVTAAQAPVRHPRAYLDAMVRRGARQELRLSPSLRALARHAGPPATTAAWNSP
jgi:replication initiation protein RepC